MSEPVFPLDLKFLPDWLKESAPVNPYANYQSRDAEGSGRFGGRDAQRRSSQSTRRNPDEPRRRHPDAQRSGGPRSPRHPNERGERGERSQRGSATASGGRSDRNQSPQTSPNAPAPEPAPVRIEFLPDPSGAANIAKQIRQSARAFPLFATARLFLEKPERHAVRITSLDAERPLFQIGNSPLSFDRAQLERNAFRELHSQYYREEVTEIEPPKGNYTSIARCRSTGTWLGPTSYHGYQVAIRKLYEERFSRRMSFLRFQQDEIEIVAGEQAVADWKTSLSKQTTFHTLQEAEPLTFKSLAEAETHFRKNYLPNLVKSATTLQCPGRAAREITDRALIRSIREAFDRELGYPASMVHALRPFLNEQNLQVFKHRKRALFLSFTLPKRADSSQSFSEGPAAILKTVEEHPKITRRDLAQRILGPEDSAAPQPPETAPIEPPLQPPLGETPNELPEPSERKKRLAADVHYLIHAGFLIEFSNGELELPLSPNAQTSSASAIEDPSEDTPEGSASPQTTAPASLTTAPDSESSPSTSSTSSTSSNPSIDPILNSETDTQGTEAEELTASEPRTENTRESLPPSLSASDEPERQSPIDDASQGTQGTRDQDAQSDGNQSDGKTLFCSELEPKAAAEGAMETVPPLSHQSHHPSEPLGHPELQSQPESQNP